MNIDVLSVALLEPAPGASRPEKTRLALLKAGLHFLAEGETDVPILSICQRAGVSNGSFYNAFESKQQFFEQSAYEAVNRFSDLLAEESLLEGPADVSAARNLRIVGRVHRIAPMISEVLIRMGADYYSSGSGFIEKMRMNITRGMDSGAFHVADPEAAVGTIVGAMLMLGRRLHDSAELSDKQATDALCEDLMRMLGVPDQRAKQLAWDKLTLPPLLAEAIAS